MNFLELFELSKAADAQHAPNGQSWPMSLTLADGTHLPAVRCRRITSSAPPAHPVWQRFIGHDLGRNILIDVDLDDLTDARLIEGTWEEVVLPEAAPQEDLLSRAAYERRRAKAVLTENVPIRPIEGDVIPFSFVVLDFSSPHGGEPSRFETTIATSLIDKSVVDGSKVWAEYEEHGLAHTNVVCISPR